MSDSRGRAIELVLSVKNKQDIESSNNLWVWSIVFISDFSVHHIKEIFDVSKVFIWWNNCFSNSVSITGSSDERSASEDSIDMFVSFLKVLVNVSTNIGWVGLWEERAHASDEGRHHSHWMSIMSKRFDKISHASVIIAIFHNFSVESSCLFLIWELSIDYQESGFQEIRFFSELLNWVTSVFQYSFFSIDITNSRNAINSIHISWIETSSYGTLW